MLRPRLRAAPDFVLTMTSACRRATLGFRLHKDLHPHVLHPSLNALFMLTSNPSSLILQRLHCLLPHIASVGCSPTTPHSSCVQAFLPSISPNSACDRIRTYCTTYLNNATHHEFCTHAPEHLHLLPSILSPHTSYPIIALCHSNPSNQLAPWIFVICIKRKLRLAIYNANTKPYCPWGRRLDPYRDHVFQCKRICKIGAHNSIRDSLPSILTPALSSAGYLLPTSKFTDKPMLHLPSDPNARPFDIAFDPDPALPPNVAHACPYTSIGADITISCPPPCPNFDLDSPDV